GESGLTGTKPGTVGAIVLGAPGAFWTGALGAGLGAPLGCRPGMSGRSGFPAPGVPPGPRAPRPRAAGFTPAGSPSTFGAPGTGVAGSGSSSASSSTSSTPSGLDIGGGTPLRGLKAVAAAADADEPDDELATDAACPVMSSVCTPVPALSPRSA